MFTHAIVRRPCPAIVDGLSTSDLGKPIYKIALQQHLQYIKALMACGLKVTILDPDNRYPDSTFVEDTALLTPRVAIITNPGAPSRKGETKEIASVFCGFYKNLEYIESPGTVDAGDIMMVGSHYYVGLSERTNKKGANQVIEILEKYQLSGSLIPLENMLHLKTGISYLENNTFLATGEFIDHAEFKNFRVIPVDDDENYAANSIWINDCVIMPAGYPKTKKAVEQAGYKILTINTSEFRKIDGGVSCLSLRFTFFT
jgi:dimethylargininase